MKTLSIEAVAAAIEVAFTKSTAKGMKGERLENFTSAINQEFTDMNPVVETATEKKTRAAKRVINKEESVLTVCYSNTTGTAWASTNSGYQQREQEWIKADLDKTAKSRQNQPELKALASADDLQVYQTAAMNVKCEGGQEMFDKMAAGVLETLNLEIISKLPKGIKAHLEVKQEAAPEATEELITEPVEQEAVLVTPSHYIALPAPVLA